MTHHRNPSIAGAIAASLLLATLASSPRAQPPDGTRAAAHDREVSRLKMAYLRCERAASERLLGMGDAADCSLVYEELLRVGFGRDFRRLLAWWHAERLARSDGERP
jgi:hypothetical protein